jgi:hypothetical protein
MVRPGRDGLHGTEGVDETYWASDEQGLIDRRTYEKALIVVATEEHGRDIADIRLR